MYKGGGEEKPDDSDHPQPLPIFDPWKDLSKIFQTVWRHHRKVWVLNEAVDENDKWREKLEKMMKLQDGQLTTFFRQYELTPVEYRGKKYFFEIVKPVPSPTPELESKLNLTPLSPKALKKKDNQK